MEELSKLLDVEIERLQQSQHLQLTEGWSTSPHYLEGFVAGQMDVLTRLRELIERMA